MATSAPSPERRHLVLVGMMGSGKTTIGRAVARRAGRPFLDSDAQIEARTGRTVREIFEADGEAVFRAFETEALAEAVGSPEPAVIAAAGGAVLSDTNRALLRGAGRTVWLRAQPGTLVHRVRNGVHRPLLADDAEGVIEELTARRARLYEEVADVIVDVDFRDKRELIDEIVGLVP